MSKTRRLERAIKILPSGRTAEIPLKEALRMLRNSEADLVGRNPYQVKVIHCPIYDEEQDFLAGELVRGATRGRSGSKLRGRFNGSEYQAPVLRVRPPREVRRISPGELLCRQNKREYLQRRGWEAA